LALWHWSLNLQRKVLLTLASMGLHGIQWSNIKLHSEI
jgi:hypothetical protein